MIGHIFIVYLTILSMCQSWYYDLNIRICIFNQLGYLFYFIFCWFTVVTSLVPEWIIMASGFLRSIDLMWSSVSSVAHPVCGLTFTLWSFETPDSAKPFIIESPMIKTFFLSLVTFFSFCGVSIPLGSLIILSVTASTSGFFLLDFYKLVLDSFKLL